jgi:hypothetical protein
MRQKNFNVKNVLSNYKKNLYGRVLLAEQRKLTSFPDLLLAQKKGFDQFINYYIHELFKEIMPIEYTA